MLLAMKVYRPMETAMLGVVVCVCVWGCVVVGGCRFFSWGGAVVGGEVRIRSPRMQTWGWMTARPPRIMCWVPWSWERRATLLPVSVSM